ncbi:MAG: galactokinase [Acidobacteriaceae bacterium]|jgi:galactokinase
MINTAGRATFDLRKQFEDVYGGTARLFRAPGRVNLIGEHTDYNDGFVMPAAIEFDVWVAVAEHVGRTISVRSCNFPDVVEIDLDAKETKKKNHWSDYVTGVALALERAGHRLRGADLLIRGDVPMGSGLSSSAAVEIASALALLAASDKSMDPVSLAKLCQRAENEFVGARVGIMDQFVSACGRAGHALMLDCRSLEYRLLPLPAGVSLVICNTLVKHSLASGEYNTRRAECERGVRLLSRFLPDVRSLRDVNASDLERYAGELPEIIYHRCRHVVLENARVEEAASALRSGDLELFGHLMGESHRSLRDDYEVSCDELNLMVDLASKVKGVIGCRMTGGGFGGCTINLVRDSAVPGFRSELADSYQTITGLAPQIFVSTAADGAGEVTA